jgi:hypothetical protein
MEIHIHHQNPDHEIGKIVIVQEFIVSEGRHKQFKGYSHERDGNRPDNCIQWEFNKEVRNKTFPGRSVTKLVFDEIG